MLIKASSLTYLKQVLYGLVIWGIAFFIYRVYFSGLSGNAYYDDYINLDPLKTVTDFPSALLFIFGNPSGPLGRPIALASFLLNINDWPVNISAVLRTNLLIHILNGFLVTWLLFRIVRLNDCQSQFRKLAIVISASTLWIILPILVSTTLIPIQRMASLSATFVLTGLIFYVIGQEIAQKKRLIGLSVQCSALAIGTVLAILTKENGVLLPVFALVLDITLLAPRKRPDADRKLRLIVLGGVTAIILCYLLFNIPSYMNAKRNFTLWQRVITEPLILWDYLRLAFFPQISMFSPYHENYPYVASLSANPWAIVAIIAWLSITIQAIRWRNRYPVFAFAVLWFLAAHLLESTVIPLELYFEHRNYLALLGPCFGLAVVGWSRINNVHWSLPPVALMVYLFLMTIMLWQTTSLWGNRAVAAEIWYRKDPTSIRAVQGLATIYVNENGDLIATQKVIDQLSAAHCPGCSDMVWPGLQVACFHEPAENIQLRVKSLLDKATTIKNFHIAAVALVEIQKNMAENHCNGLTLNDFESLNRTLLDNVGLRQNEGAHQTIHHNLANIHRTRGDLNGYLLELEQAWEIKPILLLAHEIVGAFASSEQFDDASRFLKQARQQTPDNPIVREIWLARFDQLEALLEEDRTKFRKRSLDMKQSGQSYP